MKAFAEEEAKLWALQLDDDRSTEKQDPGVHRHNTIMLCSTLFLSPMHAVCNTFLRCVLGCC